MTPSTHRTAFRWLAATGGALVLASLTACAGHSQPVSQAATPLGSSGIGISGSSGSGVQMYGIVDVGVGTTRTTVNGRTTTSTGLR
ncbi:MAG: hypothetical protein WAS90_00165 [Brachymonas denitrificans]